MASSASVAGAQGGSSTVSGVGTNAPHGNPMLDLIEYKVRLLGLLPDGYMYSQGPTRWDLTTASFCKVPSEMTCYDGKIDKKGHPTLIGSGILERKYGLTVQLPTIAESERAASVARSSVKEQEEGEEEEDDGTHNEDDVDDDNDAILEEDEDEVDGSGNESGSECSEYDKRGKPDTEPKFICQECQQNAAQNQKDNLMTKWLKNNFDPRRDALPDIVCRRTVLTYIMTQKQPFILNAKKISFYSSSDPDRKEHTVIHVEFDYLPSPDCEPHPPGGRSRAASRASKTPDEMPTSEKNFDAESYYEKPNLIGYFAGKLCCRVATIAPENRSIRILLSAIVDGLWNKKPDPELYRTGDLAEVKSTMDTTVVSDPAKGGSPHFFKQVRMAHAWAQCHLVGISRSLTMVFSTRTDNLAVIEAIFQCCGQSLEELHLITDMDIQNQNVDHVLTGLPKEVCKNMMEESFLIPLFLQGIPRKASLLNLRRLKRLIFQLEHRYSRAPLITDVTGYLAFMEMPSLEYLRLTRYGMSWSCLDALSKKCRVDALSPNGNNVFEIETFDFDFDGV